MKFKTWDEVEKELYTPEEIAESDRRVAIIGEQIKARDERVGKDTDKMAKRKNIMEEWKEFNPLAEKSIKDDFGESPSPDCQMIISYLDNGEVKAVAPSRDTDVITGESINKTNCIMTDGEYSWSGSLGYYVKKYNLQLPKEFEDKILKTQNKDGIREDGR